MNNTIENNKLIRTFMGLQPKLIAPDVYSYNDGVFFTSRGSLEQVSKSMDEYVKYHSDWNWLMKLVDKIDYQVTMNNGDYFQVSINKHKTSIIRKDKLSNPYLSDEIIGEGESKIEATYNACISFIHWYNQQSK